jgi:hypothetical protein
MIGHYLLTLTPEQEGRVLGERMARADSFLRDDGCRCLLGVTDNVTKDVVHYLAVSRTIQQMTHAGYSALHQRDRVGVRFDNLCARFGEERVNMAIRNRILTNQARRTLTTQAVLAG